MTEKSIFKRDSGIAAAEFALGAPFLLALVYGLAQLAIVMFAQAGLNHAIGQASRVASTFPRPADDLIRQAATESRFGLDTQKLSTPELTHSTVAGVDYLRISLSYSMEVDMLFLPSKPLTLTESRLIPVHPPAT